MQKSAQFKLKACVRYFLLNLFFIKIYKKKKFFHRFTLHHQTWSDYNK